MAWVRFEDITAEHPKFEKLGSYAPLCGWLWFSACCYSMRHLTDGLVSHDTLKRLWPYEHIGISTGGVPGLFEVGDDPTAEDLICLLVACNLLEKRRNGTYLIHDFLDYNPSRATITQLRENKKKAGQAGGLASAQARAQASGVRVLDPSPTPTPTPLRKKEKISLPPHPQTPDPDWKLGPTVLQALEPTRFRVLATERVWWQTMARTHPAVNFAREISKAEAWCVSTPAKAPRREYKRFLNHWFGNAQADAESTT